MFNSKFSNIDDIDEWLVVEKIYKENEKRISIIKNNLVEKYGFDEVLAEDSILYELSLLVYKNHALFKGKRLFHFFLYYTIQFILFILSPLLFLHNLFQKKYSYSLLFEEMWDERSLYSRFYQQIDIHIKKNISSALFLTTPSLKKITDINKIQGWESSIIDSRNNNIFYNYKIVLKMIKSDYSFGFSLYKASVNIDLLYLYIRILRRILMHSSQVNNIKADIIISAVDYYWNPIKYYYYKKKINHVILTQHNHKDNYLFGRALMYSDYYFAHSNDSIDKMSINQNATIKSIGSLQLVDFLGKKDESPKYDILFINQTVNDNLTLCSPLLNQSLLIKSHAILIDNFYKYTNNHRDIKIAYMTKPTYMDIEPAKGVRKIFDNYNNIDFIEAYGQETFTLVNSAKLIINMYSSVGRESYGLDKRTLWINYNNCCDLFDLDIENDDIHTLVTNTSYKAFEDRVDLLLSDNREVDEHYRKLKEKYMNIQGNPAKIVADEINKILEKKNENKNFGLYA